MPFCSWNIFIFFKFCRWFVHNIKETGLHIIGLMWQFLTIICNGLHHFYFLSQETKSWQRPECIKTKSRPRPTQCKTHTAWPTYDKMWNQALLKLIWKIHISIKTPRENKWRFLIIHLLYCHILYVHTGMYESKGKLNVSIKYEGEFSFVFYE